VTDPEGRPVPPFTGDERDLLTGFLDFHRATFEWKCAGLSDDQLAQRAVPPSTMSLLGLARHLADVESVWSGRVSGSVPAPRYYSAADPDGDFDGAVADPRVVADGFASWRAAVAGAREVAARTPLDATFVHPRDGATSLRWVLIHLIEEYARHNGHADLLRERIDGATGE
jgi:uncharacterized damage-inducible protein DinB